MFELIIIIAIYFYIYKYLQKQNSPFNSIHILEKNGFHDLKTSSFNSFSSIITGIKNGENFLFLVPKNNAPISVTTINSFALFAKEKHIHNAIIINYNSFINPDAMKKISEKNIIIWNKDKLNNFSNTTENNYNENTSKIFEKMPLDDHCEIDEPDDPIKEGGKTNSLFGNLFNNKIEKL